MRSNVRVLLQNDNIRYIQGTTVRGAVSALRRTGRLTKVAFASIDTADGRACQPRV